MSVSTSGFALRVNGTCASNQEDCGATVNPYRVCCPESSFCPASYNVDCCPTSANCTSTLLKDPQCANSSWTLYDNGGFFCCLPGYTGYAATKTGSNGCAEPGYSFQPGEVLLKVISAGQEPTSSVSSSSSSTASSTATTTSSAATASSSSEPEGDSGLSGGAIGGIVVGVIGAIAVALAVAWFIWRRRRPSSPQPVNEMPDNSRYPPPATKPGLFNQQYTELESHPRPAELDEQHGANELDPGMNYYSHGPAHELDSMEIPKRTV